MFEDILGTPKKKITSKGFGCDVKQYQADPFCIHCQSKDVRNTGNGVFIQGKRFKSLFKCNFCGQEWYVIFNENTDVDSVVYLN